MTCIQSQSWLWTYGYRYVEVAKEPVNEPELDQKATSVFAGKVVRKDLVRKVKAGANVPVFMLEYLLGKYCATDDPAAIDAGLRAAISGEVALSEGNAASCNVLKGKIGELARRGRLLTSKGANVTVSGSRDLRSPCVPSDAGECVSAYVQTNMAAAICKCALL